MHALDDAWDTIKREFDSACSQTARAARCQITNELNQVFRRLRHYQSESEWISAVLDAASRFVQQVAVLGLQDGVLTLRAQYNLKVPGDLSFPLSSARAFANAIDSRDPIIALRTSAEVTEAFSAPEADERAHIIPIANGARIVAVLFAADQDYIDVNALELIGGLASAVLERRSNTSLHAQIAPAQRDAEESPALAPGPAETAPKHGASDNVGAPSERPRLPSWADLNEEHRNIHIRAQRFSRVSVAEMQLANPEGCRAGRQQSNLYLFLRDEIDRARETYRQQFITIPSMVDYLHLELVRAAAEGDELKLGADYPGQLV